MEELAAPYYIFKAEGWSVDVASMKAGSCHLFIPTYTCAWCQVLKQSHATVCRGGKCQWTLPGQPCIWCLEVSGICCTGKTVRSGRPASC